jgi:hypothetical protein
MSATAVAFLSSLLGGHMFSSYGTSEDAKIKVKELLDAEDIGHAAPV